MHEYDVNFLAAVDGGLALSIHAPGSTGTHPYLRFGSFSEVRTFFEAAGLNDPLLDELGRTAADLQPGCAYHERLYLPDSCEERLKSISTCNSAACQTSSSVAAANGKADGNCG
ncbi:MAG TPA: hypothetical protein VH351_13980 [Bryobacteraceae bacterium]|jgi:hypothetical protein|nr:hypothetical protein [Bryobacteraceae bacterium]